VDKADDGTVIGGEEHQCTLKMNERKTMNLLWVLGIVLLIVALVGAPGVGPWQHSYGYWPSGGVGLVVLILVILLLAGRL
jgi:hypothetical protein